MIHGPLSRFVSKQQACFKCAHLFRAINKQLISQAFVYWQYAYVAEQFMNFIEHQNIEQPNRP